MREVGRFLWGMFKRYLPMEICGTITAMLAGIIVYNSTENTVLAAVAAAWSENIGFYGYAAYAEVRKYYKTHTGGWLSHVSIFFKSLRNLLTEFGMAEIGDTILIRPALMTLFQALLGAGAIGLFVGKIAADIIFYVIAAIGFLIRKNCYKGQGEEED